MKPLLSTLIISTLVVGFSAIANSIEELSTEYSFEGSYFTQAELDVKPIPIKQKLPKRSASNPKGQAVVTFLISTEGIPEQIQVLGATDKYFLQSAKATVKKWRFEPGKVKRKPVASSKTFGITYRRNLSSIEKSQFKRNAYGPSFPNRSQNLRRTDR